MALNMDATIIILCDNHYAVNRHGIRIKTRRHVIHASRFAVDHTIDGTSVCDVSSKVAGAMFTELTGHAAANIVELFVQILVAFHDVAV